MFSKAAAIIALIPALAAAQTCTDSTTFKFNIDTGPEQDCAWLNKSLNTADRISKYCAYGSVKWACQATCGSCAATCADSKLAFTLDFGGAVANACPWLAKKASRTTAYCKRGAETAPKAGFEVGAACPATCGFCPV